MVIEVISPNHNRIAFTCGNEKLDRYIHENAYQAKRKGLAVTFVAIDPVVDPSHILGCYALSSFLIEGLDIPETLRKSRRLPSHYVGATLLGRLAVDRTAQGRGVGTRLVADALKRAHLVSADVGSTAVVVDAIDERAAAFYAQFGFMRMRNDDLRLVLTMDTIAQQLSNTEASREETRRRA